MRYIFSILLVISSSCSSPQRGTYQDVQSIVEQRISVDISSQSQENFSEPIQAVQAALLNNPEMHARYERLSIAKADVVQAGIPANPSVECAVRFPLAVDVNIVENILDLFLIPTRSAVATSELEQVRYEVAHEVLTLVSDVHIAFYRYQTALQMDKMLSAIADAASVSATYSMRQRQAGNLSELDQIHHQLLYEKAELDRSENSLAVVEAREILGRLMGLNREWGIGGGLDPVPTEVVSPEALEDYAVQNRLDLKATTFIEERSQRLLKSARITRWFGGSLDVGASMERDRDGAIGVGPSISFGLPLFDQQQARIARLDSELRRQTQLRLALELTIRSDVRSLVHRLQTLQRKALHYRDVMIPLHEKIVHLSQKQYNYMLVGLYTVLGLKREEILAYREYLEVTRDYWITRTQLRLALGGAFPS